MHKLLLTSTFKYVTTNYLITYVFVTFLFILNINTSTYKLCCQAQLSLSVPRMGTNMLPHMVYTIYACIEPRYLHSTLSTVYSIECRFHYFMLFCYLDLGLSQTNKYCKADEVIYFTD